MENKKKYRGVNWGSILLFILIIGGILWMANKVQMHQQEISYSTFCKRSRSGECHGGRYQTEQCCADRTGDVVIER